MMYTKIVKTEQQLKFVYYLQQNIFTINIVPFYL